MQAKLNAISSKVFPVPQSHTADSINPEQAGNGRQSQAERVSGSNMLKYHLRPASRVDTLEASREPPFNAAAIQAELAQGTQRMCLCLSHHVNKTAIRRQ